MSESSLAKKLKLKPGSRAAVINAPENYLQDLKHDLDIAQKLSGKLDWIQIFAKNKKQLASFAPKAASALKPDSILWLSFPKGSSKLQTDLTRDKGWGTLKDLDLKFITLVSVNDRWSAFAFRPYKDGEARQSVQLGE
jgi:hypothetical protein